MLAIYAIVMGFLFYAALTISHVLCIIKMGNSKNVKQL